MRLEKPTLVIATGLSGTGKTTILQEVCRRTPNTVYLEKDGLNQAFLVARDEGDGDARPFTYFNGEQMLEIPWGSEFYGRHVRDQTYIAFATMALQNLQLGKSPVIDCFVNRQIGDRTLDGFLAQFNDFPTALLHFSVQEQILKQRLIERAGRNPYAAERDGAKVESDGAWRAFLQEQPIIWPEMKHYTHLVLDTSQPSDYSVAEARAFIQLRSTTRDDLLTRVDERGNILGGVHYLIAHPESKTQKGVRHISATGFIFKTPERRQVLIQQRFGVYKSGVWDSSVGGQGLYGETPLQTQNREGSEELFNNGPLPAGLEFAQVAQFPKQTRPNDSEFVFLHEAIYSGPFSPNPKEIRRVKFVDVDWLRGDIADNSKRYTNSIRVCLDNYLAVNGGAS